MFRNFQPIGTSSSLNDGLRYNSNAGNTFLSQDGTHFPHHKGPTHSPSKPGLIKVHNY